MLARLKSISAARITLLFNFFYIGVIKFLNIGAKYVLVGYLIRALGEEGYGLLTWVDSIVQYFIMIINFGFDLYAAKYVIDNKNNPRKLNEVISTVYYIKAVLFLLCFLMLIPLALNAQIYEVLHLVALMLLMGMGEVLTPVWFFQGIEKMKPLMFITFFSKLILIVLTFLFIKNSNDMTLYIYFLVITSIFLGVLSFIMMKKEVSFRFVKVSYDVIKGYLKEGYLFFIGRFSTFFFNMGTLFLIGYLFSKGQVAGFDIATKIIFVFIIPFEVLQQALFPRVVNGVSNFNLKKIIAGTLLSSIVLMTLVFLFSKEIIYIFGGEEMLKYEYVLKMMLYLIPIVGMTIITGNCILVAKGFSKEYNTSLILSAVLFLLIIFLLYLTGNASYYNIIAARIFADIILLAFRLYYLRKKVLL